jgi:hypothetical protein
MSVQPTGPSRAEPRAIRGRATCQASFRLLRRLPRQGGLPLCLLDTSSILEPMQLRDLLSRLWPRRAGRSGAAKTRYDDASRLEETTQSHYRSITGSDARGRPTKAEDTGDRPRQD